MALSTSESLSTAPSPNSLTLLFKHHKSTTLLSVFPAQRFSEIKVLLLLALQSRNITSFHSNTNTPVPLPESAEDIEFGVLADKKDVSRGWVSLDARNGEPTKPSKGKKKEKPTPALGDDDTSSKAPETPAGAGLVDGSFVAYRIRAPPTKRRRGKSSRTAKTDFEDDEDGDAMFDVDTDAQVDSAADAGWDVILPTFEEEDREDKEADDMIDEGINGR